MTKRVAQAWAFASILLLPNYADLTSGAGDARMRSPVPLTGIALAQLTDMVVVALLFFGAMEALRRIPGWTKIRWSLMALLPVLLFARNLDVMPFDVRPVTVLAGGVVWAAVLGALILKASRFAVKLRGAGSTLLAGFVVFAVMMTWQLGSAALWRPGPQVFRSPVAVEDQHRQRLVWILFDELAYKPTFEARDPSLHLPNFDRLRAESTLYTDMTPIAYRTTRAVPSLLLGLAVTDVTYTTRNQYLVQMENDPHWQTLDPNETLFGMAKQNGLTTSIVGWYIAYCPVFVGVATDCYWANEDAQDRGPTSTSESFAENVWFPLRILVEQVVAPSHAWADVAAWNAKGHEAAVKDLEQHALETAANSQADIVYLHLPVPHPPAVWDRRTGSFALGGSYLDSLDYSDRLLGRILDVLEAQPRWAETTLIVHGDHSWRTEMWRPLPGWSAEDERISHGGKWDPRPLLLIHTPGQLSAQTVTAPTSVMYIHDTVAARIQAMSDRQKSAGDHHAR
ncbi:MAG: sulfatase-like hydrolase/transferase [Terracidiphilus sp.]|jgi:arylsulfatase A-like enzyme